MVKKKRLGRGLEALLNAVPDSSSEFDTSDDEPTILPLDAARSTGTVETTTTESVSVEPGNHGDRKSLLSLEVTEIDDNPFQPRRDFGESEIASLAESLKEHEMLQPILVRRVGDRYQLISGERRLRAAIRAGWSRVPAQLRDANDRLVAELAIVENLQRKDLNPLEKALSFKRYLHEHGCPQEELANRLKIDRSTIANLMRLLELPSSVQNALRTGIITAGHARALLPLGEEQIQIEFCNLIQKDGWSVRATEQKVQDRIYEEDRVETSDGSENKKRGRTKTRQIESLERQFRLALGTKVEIKQNANGKGRIVIHFANNEEFLRLQSEVLDDSAVEQLRHAS